ncbi:hypothetical protein Q763_05330 [Flavobacterium beibuense F44-8]|uniref:DoxX family protein n=1 Tax=Flavobacterium beibuense F44-8 TaxID=1406840 RepID=A0A0A2LRE0_9FLAO|nr:hypothetical protein [Flavobacterium beibuense]KGO82524.1 hypothetical protein Q763_05330 [Flavobacterium beibuense F44-8]
MDVLIVLFTVFIVGIVISKLTQKDFKWRFNGNLAMCCMLCFTGVGHFLFTEGMAMMLPGVIPYREALVYITGIAEIIFGILLLFPVYRKTTGVIIILFFVLVLPANIYAALHNVNLMQANYTGKGVGYLWFRIPLQVFLIVWIYISSVREEKNNKLLF